MNDERLGNSARIVVGLGLIVIGILFFIARYLEFNIWHYIWPFFVIIPGLLFLLGMALGGRSVSGLAIPGCIITCLGLIFLYQTITGHWTSWAYIWALIFPISVGLGIYLMGTRNDDERSRQVGMGFIKTGVIILLVGAVFFEVVLDISGFRSGVFGRVVLPVVLILLGLYLVFNRGRRPAED